MSENKTPDKQETLDDLLDELEATQASYETAGSTRAIKHLDAQRSEVRAKIHSLLSAKGDTERLDWLESQLKYGWGDGFVMQAMDSGGQYVRPWRKANEALYPPDPKSKAGVWQADIRTAIDEAMLAEKQTSYVNSKVSKT